MGGTFTVPGQLAVKAPAYSIAQIALSFGADDIELGWIVAPGIYRNQHPHLFVFFRSYGGACEEGIPHQTTPYCPLDDSTGYVNLNSKYFPGMQLIGKTAFLAVGSNPQLYAETASSYYDSNRAVNSHFSSSFNFGGPHKGPSGC
jgi:hypothetical protein